MCKYGSKKHICLHICCNLATLVNPFFRPVQYILNYMDLILPLRKAYVLDFLKHMMYTSFLIKTSCLSKLEKDKCGFGFKCISFYLALPT